jgi:hypothetical protein
MRWNLVPILGTTGFGSRVGNRTYTRWLTQKRSTEPGQPASKKNRPLLIGLGKLVAGRTAIFKIKN